MQGRYLLHSVPLGGGPGTSSSVVPSTDPSSVPGRLAFPRFLAFLALAGYRFSPVPIPLFSHQFPISLLLSPAPFRFPSFLQPPTIASQPRASRNPLSRLIRISISFPFPLSTQHARFVVATGHTVLRTACLQQHHQPCRPTSFDLPSSRPTLSEYPHSLLGPVSACLPTTLFWGPPDTRFSLRCSTFPFSRTTDPRRVDQTALSAS